MKYSSSYVTFADIVISNLLLIYVFFNLLLVKKIILQWLLFLIKSDFYELI